MKEKKRFLVCFLMDRQTQNVTMKTYPIKDAVVPDEVTYPKDTFMFLCVRTQNIEKFKNGFMGVNVRVLDFYSVTLSSQDYEIENNTIYDTGKGKLTLGKENKVKIVKIS